jgi:hypothetical protein
VSSFFQWLSRILPGKIYGIVGGRGLGGACDHINHFGCHIKEVWLLEA